MIKDETSTANPTYADSKTGGSLPTARPLQRDGYTLDSNRRATFTKGNKLAPIPKALRLHAREFILNCIQGEGGVKKVIAKIYAQATRGNFRAQELLLNYIFGRPTERVQIESNSNHNVVIVPTVKIIADNLRLGKLQKDSDNAPPIVEAFKVEDMEAVLNRGSNGTATVNIDPLPEDAPPKGKRIPIYKESKKKGIVKTKKKQKKKR